MQPLGQVQLTNARMASFVASATRTAGIRGDHAIVRTVA